MQQAPVVESLAKTFGLMLSFIALVKAFGAAAASVKRHREAKKAKQEEQMNLLKKLCKGQDELDSRMDGIERKLADMDHQRHEARVEDAKVRANLYLGTVAIVDSVMRLAEHQGLTINGEVAAYRRANIEYLKNGVGMTPIHAASENEEG